MISFFNTLTGRIEPFKPLQAREVKLYTCGPTVYDHAHIGNFRAFVFEDLLRRFLEFEGFKVRHAMNLTDVDDKTIAGANRTEKLLDDYTETYIRSFREDLQALNCLEPEFQPRATREIAGPGGMIELIQKLIDRKIAYESEGSVYFRVSSFPGYGKLSKKKLDQNIAGASTRVDVDEYDREQISDFVLWKKAREGEPYWDSPWGKGRPGWHIECSAMSMRYLGETIDIHAGGEDLIFPHHENEIAQSEAVTGKPFVRYWMHCKHLMVDGEKMSKSKGNFYTLRDLLVRGFDPMAIRYELLSAHYRAPLNFTLEGLKQSEESLRKMDDAYFQILSRLALGDYGKSASGFQAGLKSALEEISGHLRNDLNIAGAFSTVFGVLTMINTQMTVLSEPELKAGLDFFRQIDRLFGFHVLDAEGIPAHVLKWIRERAEVRRKIKETQDKGLWKTSDELRDKIQSAGWIVKDGRPGELSTVKRKRRAWDK